MLALCLMLFFTYYAQNYSGMIGTGLVIGIPVHRMASIATSHLKYKICTHIRMYLPYNRKSLWCVDFFVGDIKIMKIYTLN